MFGSIGEAALRQLLNMNPPYYRALIAGWSIVASRRAVLRS